MTAQIWLVAGILAVGLILLVADLLRADLVALLIMSAIMLTGLASPQEALAGFANPATVTVAGMFVLSAALDRTGALAPLCRLVTGWIRERGPRVALIPVLLLVGLLSAFVNNTAAVAIFLPVIMVATQRIPRSPSKFLMPLSFVAMLGGLLTLVGTSTNLLVNGIARGHGVEAFGIFDFAPLGMVMLAAGMVYLVTVGYGLVPQRRSPRTLGDEFGLDPHPEEAGTVLVEAGITSSMEGTTLDREDVERRYGARALAVRRTGRTRYQGLGEVPLKAGDTVLFRVFKDHLGSLRHSPMFLLLSDDEGPSASNRAKPWVAGAILVLVVLVAACKLLPIVVCATIGALATVLTGCLRADEAYRAVDWKIIFLLAGMLSLEAAMEATGATRLLAHHVLAWLGDCGPRTILAALYVLGTLLTAVLSNNATAVLLAPLAISVASQLSLDPRPFLVAVAFSASACFSSPLGYQTNLMVYGPGRFTFMDFVRAGLPLNLILMGLSVWLIPVAFPFEPS
ncbi:MAG: SLC13 family permease [Candidatus Eremiobacteraeota bacterium]|nr:SLC13 family permease [Candidatus Eremiobacteraeota bacterium]